MENQENSSAIEDFRMKYKILIDDIKYIKSRQWTVTYYLLLLYAAVIGFSKYLNSVDCIQKNQIIQYVEYLDSEIPKRCWRYTGPGAKGAPC